MNALSVSEALEQVLNGAQPRDKIEIAITDALGMVLAEDLKARITQPPFHASAMDGYAVRSGDIGNVPVRLKIVGESAAGHGMTGTLKAGEAARIFTGAPVPDGADTIVIQEDTERNEQEVLIQVSNPPGTYIRRQGYDFAEGDVLLSERTLLTARTLSLAAAMNHDKVSVFRQPRVAILSTGDELVMPGEKPNPEQIISSTPVGLAALVSRSGGIPDLLGIARDTAESLGEHIEKAKEADILVTIGGASVGDHDLVQEIMTDHGMKLDFWKIAMRPGKPLMFGSRNHQRILGLPGNPVSAMICGRIFLVPLVKKLAGLRDAGEETRSLPLAQAVSANGPREHYMRAEYVTDKAGNRQVRTFDDQDSSLLATLARADCLVVRPVGDIAREAGAEVPVLALDF